MCFFRIPSLRLQLLAPLDEKAWEEGIEMLKTFAYRLVAVVQFTDQN